MVVLKRPSTENKQRLDYDEVIELDDRKSFAASQKDNATQLYTTRDKIAQPVKEAQPQKKGEVMPSISAQPKNHVVPRQVVSSKTKVLLAAYIIIAVILAAVVIGTGVAITEMGRRADGLEQQVAAVSVLLGNQEGQLSDVNSDVWQAEQAQNYGMDKVENPVTVQLVDTVESASYSQTTNGFDKFRDFISKIFG